MKRRILVVDDFGSDRKLVCETLNRKGYATIGAASLIEALTLLRYAADEIHLVLTDYNMSDGTGFDLLKNVKQNPATTKIPVIIWATEANLDKIQSAKEAGLATWLKKPYRSEHLFDEIHKALVNVAIPFRPWGNHY